jgi:hypothetical protein
LIFFKNEITGAHVHQISVPSSTTTVAMTTTFLGTTRGIAVWITMLHAYRGVVMRGRRGTARRVATPIGLVHECIRVILEHVINPEGLEYIHSSANDA